MMDIFEQKIKTILGEEDEIPEVVIEKKKQAFAQIKAKEKKSVKGVSWRKYGIAIAACLLIVIGFHSQIISFAETLWIHTVSKIGNNKTESELQTVPVTGGILKENEDTYFESIEDVENQLGITLLKSKEAYRGKEGKVEAFVLTNENGMEYVEIFKTAYCLHNVEIISEDGSCFHTTKEDGYQISYEAAFFTKKAGLKSSISINETATFIENYKTAKGLDAAVYMDGEGYKAEIYYENVVYTFTLDGIYLSGKESIENLKTFLDTLE